MPILMVSLGMFLYGVKSTEKVVAEGLVLVLLSPPVFTINLFRNGSLEPGEISASCE